MSAVTEEKTFVGYTVASVQRSVCYGHGDFRDVASIPCGEVGEDFPGLVVYSSVEKAVSAARSWGCTTGIVKVYLES